MIARTHGEVGCHGECLLVDGLFDALTLRAETLSLLPTHLLQHLEAHVLTCQLELFVVRQIRLPAFLQSLQSHNIHIYRRE